MDIVAIDEAIENLENSETTKDNVFELSALYIVRNNFNNVSDPVRDQLNDVFPYYNKYKIIKQRYQKNQAIDYEVIQGIKDVCREINEFIDTLYNNTDMHKERMCIKSMIKQMAEKYED